MLLCYLWLYCEFCIIASWVLDEDFLLSLVTMAVDHSLMLYNVLRAQLLTSFVCDSKTGLKIIQCKAILM